MARVSNRVIRIARAYHHGAGRGFPPHRRIGGKSNDALAELDPADVGKVVDLEPDLVGPADLWQSTAPERDFLEEIQHQIAALEPTRST